MMTEVEDLRNIWRRYDIAVQADTGVLGEVSEEGRISRMFRSIALDLGQARKQAVAKAIAHRKKCKKTP
jgi:hypothetical protein